LCLQTELLDVRKEALSFNFQENIQELNTWTW